MKEQKLTQAMNRIDDELIDGAINCGASKKSVKKFSAVKWGSLAACLCLVVLSVVVWKTGVIGNLSPARTPSNAGVTTDKNDKKPKDKIKINKVEGIGQMDIDAVQNEISEKLPYVVYLEELKKFKDFIGTEYDVFVAKADASLSLKGCHGVSVRGIKDGKISDKYSLHDYVFEYSQDGTEKELTVAVSSIDSPVRDVFIDNDNPKQSVINGCSMCIYSIGSTYMACFSHDGLYYDMEAKEVTLDEFVTFVKAYIS